MITLKTLWDADPQAIFDQAANHLLTQNKRALDIQGKCQYKTIDEKPLKCAVGCFISDDEYDPIFEGQGVNGVHKIFNKLELALPVRLINNGNLLNDLQIVHDLREVHTWPHELTGVAQKYNLSPATLEKYLI